MRIRTILLLALLYVWFGKDGISQTTEISPDCTIPFSFSAASAPLNAPSTSPYYSNKAKQCGTWVISFQAPTTVTAISLALQSASDAGGNPGTFGTFSGTAVAGTNPFGNSDLPNAFAVVQGNPAYVRVHLTSATGTGTITGFAYGWIIPPQVYTSGGGGGATSNVNVIQWGSTNTTLGQKAMAASVPVALASDQTNLPTLPVGATQAMADGFSNSPTVPEANNSGATPATMRVFPFEFNGTSWDRMFACTNQADVALSGTSYTQVVAASGSTVIRICNFIYSSASGGNPVVNTVTLAFGTCNSSPTEAWNVGGVTGYTDNFDGSIRGTAGAALCVKESVGNADHVTVTYSQF